MSFDLYLARFWAFLMGACDEPGMLGKAVSFLGEIEDVIVHSHESHAHGKMYVCACVLETPV